MSEIWIGLLEVRSSPGSEYLANSAGAFVNVLTWASTLGEYRQKAETVMDTLGLSIVGIEEAEPLSNRNELEDDNLIEIVAGVRNNPDAIIYSTFHTWTTKN